MLRRTAINPMLMSLLIAGTAVAPCRASVATPPRLIDGVKSHSIRAVQVDLDYVYDEDPAQTERNLDQLVERIAAMHANIVFLQAFANPRGDGLAREVYFPNRSLPMRADLFAHAVRELKHRSNVKVFAWMPVLSFDLGDTVPLVHAWSPASKTAEIDPKAYRRASPFDSRVRARIANIYEDMAKNAPIDGILFHDDAVLSDFEDATPAALASYKAAGLPNSIEALRAHPDTLRAWTDFKTDYLIAFTHHLVNTVRRYRPAIETARNLYAPVLLDNESRAWFAQDFDKFLAAYDYTAIEAMPQLEKVSDDHIKLWLTQILTASAARPNGLGKTIFELQTVDWNRAGKDRAIPEDMLSAEMRLLTSEGALNLGYYPDDFMTDTPKLDLLRHDFSHPTDMTTP